MSDHRIENPSEIVGMNNDKVRCGDCRYFVRDGKCGFLASEAGQAKGRPFEYAPFWVWSDCFSDREQVRANVETCCATFDPAVKVEGSAA